MEHKGAGRRRRRRIWDRLQHKDMGLSERDEESDIEEEKAWTLSWQRGTLSHWFLPLSSRDICLLLLTRFSSLNFSFSFVAHLSRISQIFHKCLRKAHKCPSKEQEINEWSFHGFTMTQTYAPSSSSYYLLQNFTVHYQTAHIVHSTLL